MSNPTHAMTKATVGALAPDFTLIDDTGAAWQLSKHRNQIVILYFYPSDDTPGCTKQACSLRDNFQAFQKLGALVAGINYDSQASHKKFKAKYNLPFTLLSDPDKKVAKLYGAKRTSFLSWLVSWFISLPERKTIIIGKNGTVADIMNDVDVTTHTGTVLDKVRKLTMKKILLVVAHEGYQPVEYGHTREALEAAGYQVNVASDKEGTATAGTGSTHPHAQMYAQATVDVTINHVNAHDYDGIFLIGGKGALEHLDNEATYKMMSAAAQSCKAFGAICIAPRILAHADLLAGAKATGWDDDEKLAGIFAEHDVEYRNESVVSHGNIVTAQGPAAAAAFGEAIVAILKK